MNETLNWHDLQLFIAVANAAGLAGAIRTTGVSAPTLGRRMLALESATGRQLFIRHKNGYTLTQHGQELLHYAEGMQSSASDIDRWLEKDAPKPTVKMTAGAWTSRFIAQNSSSLPAGTSYRIMPDNQFFDLRRREAHLAVRNQRPTQQGLAVRKLGSVAFAVYGKHQEEANMIANRSTQHILSSMPCIAYETSGSSTASSAWLKENMGRQAALIFSSPTLVLDAAIAGAGLCVLPCFVGDLEVGLMRYSPPIPELTHIQWLVSHDEDRHLKHVRQTAKALQAIFTESRQLFAGGAERR